MSSTMWSIWNEPNHPGFLRPQFSRGGRARSPALYRKLFQAGERALQHSGNGPDRILMGETAPRGTGSVVAPLEFLRRTLCLSSSYKRRSACHRLPADGFAHHAYTTKLGPFFKPAGRDDVTIGVLGRLNRALQRAGRAGAIRRAMPIYLTEFGIQSTPDPVVGVSEARQAEYLAIAEHIAYRNRTVASLSQYLMRDSDPTPGAGERCDCAAGRDDAGEIREIVRERYAAAATSIAAGAAAVDPMLEPTSSSSCGTAANRRLVLLRADQPA